MIRIITILIILIPSLLWAYTPPKGIPDPADSFSTFGEIDQATPSTATKCPDWPTAQTAGCYYVDSTHGSATDSGNTYGYPDRPRATIPGLSLSAGNFVYIHAGTYSQNLAISGEGTASSPIWITGNASVKPILTGTAYVGKTANASYIVVENLEWNNGTYGTGIEIQHSANNIVVNNILFRSIEIDGAAAAFNNPGFYIGNYVTYTGASTSNVVVYNSTVKNLNTWSGEQDTCAFYVETSTNTWILNNTITDIQEDGVAGCHNCDTDPRPTNVFVGGNTITNMGANCTDFKKMEGIVVSENVCSGEGFKTDGNNACFVLHYGGTPSNTGPRDASILFNTCHGRPGGVALSLVENTTNIIGNLFYDINWDATTSICSSSAAECGAAIHTQNSEIGTMNVIDNTFYNCDAPIDFSSRPMSSETLNISGNLIAERAEAGRYDVNLGGNDTGTGVTMDYNLFYLSTGNANIYYDGVAHTLTQLKDHTCANCVEGTPALSSYQLTASSTNAIGANAENAAYDAFATYWAGKGFTLSAHYDRAGHARPQGGSWDIGAYEYTTSGAVSIGSGGSVNFGSGGTITLQ